MNKVGIYINGELVDFVKVRKAKITVKNGMIAARIGENLLEHDFKRVALYADDTHGISISAQGELALIQPKNP